MSKKNTAAEISELIRPTVERFGLELWDVRFEKEGSSWFLRVFIDKEGGGNYKIVGGWDDELAAEGLEMSRFVFAAKKTDGKITSGHIIVEIDPDFMGIWDSFGMEFYK